MSRKWFQRAQDVSRMNRDVATQAEAEAGTNNEKVMTPLRVGQHHEYIEGKVYRALISQSGTNAPTIDQVLLDEIGGVVTTARDDVGSYIITNSLSVFTEGRTAVSMRGCTQSFMVMTGNWDSETEVVLFTSSLTGEEDNVFDGTILEIVVY